MQTLSVNTITCCHKPNSGRLMEMQMQTVASLQYDKQKVGNV